MKFFSSRGDFFQIYIAKDVGHVFLSYCANIFIVFKAIFYIIVKTNNNHHQMSKVATVAHNFINKLKFIN